MRFDCKYASMHWALHKLTSAAYPGEKKQRLRTEILSSKECCRPLFVRSFLRQFGTNEKLGSPEACAALRLAERGMLFSTKLSEFGHANERQSLHNRGLGKSFVHHARRDLLRRARLVHIVSGGDDPSSKQKKPNRSVPAQEIAPPALMGADEEARSASERCMDPGGDFSEMLFSVGNRQMGTMDHATPALSSSSSAAASHDQAETEVGLVTTQPDGKGKARQKQLQQSGAGGSVYLTYLNTCRRSYKQARPERPLSLEEMRGIEAEARVEWATCRSKPRPPSPTSTRPKPNGGKATIPRNLRLSEPMMSGSFARVSTSGSKGV